mgnify:CR=1 FL=1
MCPLYYSHNTMDEDLKNKFDSLKSMNLNIDLTRGRPASDQLDLSDEMLSIVPPSLTEEGIDIRIYSIIYEAINEIKSAMEGMLEPTEEEVVAGNVEVREIYKISKIGTIAGCYVTNGNILRNNKIRLIRDGIVVYTGKIKQLKRFKDDVNEVKNGYECGLSIADFNDIKVGDCLLYTSPSPRDS